MDAATPCLPPAMAAVSARQTMKKDRYPLLAFALDHPPPSGRDTPLPEVQVCRPTGMADSRSVTSWKKTQREPVPQDAIAGSPQRWVTRAVKAQDDLQAALASAQCRAEPRSGPLPSQFSCRFAAGTAQPAGRKKRSHFLVWCISGSRSPLLFLVELGAAISVASTTVPLLSSNPLAASVALTVARICKLKSSSLIYSMSAKRRQRR